MVIKTIRQIQNKIETIFDNSNLQKGFGLSIEQLANEKKITYWRDFATTKGANEKSTYIVWTLENIEPIVSGDGTVLYNKFQIKLLVYTKEYLISNDLEILENNLLNERMTFEYKGVNYNPEYRAYLYLFDTVGTI